MDVSQCNGEGGSFMFFRSVGQQRSSMAQTSIRLGVHSQYLLVVSAHCKFFFMGFVDNK